MDNLVGRKDPYAMSISRVARSIVGCTALAVTASLGLVAAGTNPAAAASTVTFATVGAHNWTVPQGVSSIEVVAVGGGGGASTPVVPIAFGGSGAVVTSTLAVTPGAVLQIGVGGGGASGGPASASNTGGGGGGGASVISDSSGVRIVAGGGGGAGGLAVAGPTYGSANGGMAGWDLSGAGGGGDNGGVGGSYTTLGAGGGNGWCCGIPAGASYGGSGLGGPGGAGGATAGSPFGGSSTESAGVGGTGEESPAYSGGGFTDPGGSGGGGGGGYGGGGGAYGPGGGGAGGSLGPTGTTFRTALSDEPGAGASLLSGSSSGANGRVAITYTAVGSAPGAVAALPAMPTGAYVAYPKKGAKRGKAVVSWRTVPGATGYQYRVANTKRKLNSTAWSSVRTAKSVTLKRKSFVQYAQVRALNAFGTGPAKLFKVRRR